MGYGDKPLGLVKLPKLLTKAQKQNLEMTCTNRDISNPQKRKIGYVVA
jgi:hypothetical protein